MIVLAVVLCLALADVFRYLAGDLDAKWMKRIAWRWTFSALVISIGWALGGL